MDHLELTDQRDPRRPNLPQPVTEDEPPGTLEEVAPEDPKDPSPDTTESPS